MNYSIETETDPTNHGNESKHKFINGINNWLKVMVFTFCSLLVLENYLRFGMIKGPCEIVCQVISIIIKHWWFYVAVFLYLLQQTAQMVVLENLLAKGVLSEKIGMTFHALNVFVLPTASIATAVKYDAEKAFLRTAMVYVIFTAIKVWSYAYVNSTYRYTNQQKRKPNQMGTKDKTSLVRYPQNVTLKNAFIYMVCTPSVQYQASYFQRGKPDWKKFTKLIFQMCAVYCGINFISSQFIFPELKALKMRGDDNYIDRLQCILRILLPFNLMWFLYHYQNFKCYLPAYAAITGMKNLTFSTDWWNSADLNEFWRKWNVPINEWLKYNVVVPILKNGYSLMFAQVVAFLVAGVIHEYLNTIPFGVYNGIAFLVTFTEIPGGYVTGYVARKLGKQYGNILFWCYIAVSHSFTAVHISLNYDLI